MKMVKRFVVAGVLGGGACSRAAGCLTQTTPGTTGRDYGQHEAQCAQLMGGFSGAMNPGMHSLGLAA